MKKFKLQLSGFDIGMIVAFVVVTLLGVAAWYYLSNQLQAAQQDNKDKMAAYKQYSVGDGVVVSTANKKNLENNRTLLKSEIDPVIKTSLLADANKLRTVHGEDPVAWKHDLDEDVHQLTTAAKVHNVTLPPNFYFGFTRYLTQSPSDEQTGVLTKQRMGVKELANILINAPVEGITAFQRTYEEDPHSSTSSPGEKTEGDHLAGYALKGPGDAYTAYPFQIEFDTSPEALRVVLNQLMASPYLILVRSMEVHNSNPDSPRQADLAALAGPPATGAPSVIESGPGGASNAPPPKGPQHLFGYESLHVKLNLDMIEWNKSLIDSDAFASAPAPAPPHR